MLALITLSKYCVYYRWKRLCFSLLSHFLNNSCTDSIKGIKEFIAYIEVKLRIHRREIFLRRTNKAIGRRAPRIPLNCSWILIHQKPIWLAYKIMIDSYLPLIKFGGKVLQNERHEDSWKFYQDKEHAIRQNRAWFVKYIRYLKLKRNGLIKTKANSDSGHTCEYQ